MATCRRSVPVTTVMLLIVIGIAQLLQPAKSFSTNRQLERLLGKLNDIDDADTDAIYDENVSHVAKRESKGTCTCTCETRPVAASSSSLASEHAPQPSAAASSSGIVQHPNAKLQPENRVPESAALMRTATTTVKETKLKPQQPPQPAQQARGDARPPTPQQKASGPKNGAQSANGVGIVKVPPMPDYDSIEHSSNDAVAVEPESSEDYDESRQQQDQEQMRHSQQETWSLGSRYPWERLPDTMCFREHCSTDRDCCRRFNICDRSAHVCVDCWYGSTCTSERDCCLKYKYCQREWKPNPSTGKLEIVGGKCVNEL